MSLCMYVYIFVYQYDFAMSLDPRQDIHAYTFECQPRNPSKRNRLSRAAATTVNKSYQTPYLEVSTSTCDSIRSYLQL